MFIAWRGLGWSVLLIFAISLLVTQFSVSAIYGDTYWAEHSWPSIVAIIVASILIGIVGYFLNYKKRTVLINEETGEKEKSPSHTLFFIPIEFWAIILPVLSFFAITQSADEYAQDMAYIESPVVNDKYIVDFSEIDIFKEYSSDDITYGIMKVTSISPQGIEFVVSTTIQNKTSGVRKDIRDGKANDVNYFSTNTVVFRKDELVNFRKTHAIKSVVRD